MATTTQAKQTPEPSQSSFPRASTETDRKGLLDLLASSTGPSETSSLYTLTAPTSDSLTPRANSPAHHTRHASLASLASLASTTVEDGPYRGFPSRAQYLAALQSWADEKLYLEPQDTGTGLKGFYGETTMQEYAARPGVVGGLGLRKMWRERKDRKEGMRRQVGEGVGMGKRATVI